MPHHLSPGINEIPSSSCLSFFDKINTCKEDKRSHYTRESPHIQRSIVNKDEGRTIDTSIQLRGRRSLTIGQTEPRTQQVPVLIRRSQTSGLQAASQQFVIDPSSALGFSSNLLGQFKSNSVSFSTTKIQSRHPSNGCEPRRALPYHSRVAVTVRELEFGSQYSE